MLDPADGNSRGRPLHLKVYEVDPMLCPRCCGQMKGLTWWVSDVGISISLVKKLFMLP
jgi:hypothetical protein